MEIGRPSGPRKSVNLLVQLAEEGGNDFVEEKFATDISSGGMFIWSRTPRPVGTGFQVRVDLAGGMRVINGHAIVRWTRKADDPNGPPGMGLEFSGVDPSSKALIDRLLKPAEEPDLASQLTNELANELSNELDDGTGFTDDFAAAPPVAEDGAEFTDDFGPVGTASPEDFTDDFEELETAPVGVKIPLHLQAPPTDDLHTEPFGMKVPAARPLEDGVPDTQPRGLAIPPSAPVKLRPAGSPIGEKATETSPRGLPVPPPVPDAPPIGIASSLGLGSLAIPPPPPSVPRRAPVPIDAKVPDTTPGIQAMPEPRKAAVPLGRRADEGAAPTGRRPAIDDTADTAERAAFVPTSALTDDDAEADTGQRPAHVPGAAPVDDIELDLADTGQRPAFVPGADEDLGDFGLDDTSQRPAFVPESADDVELELGDTAQRPAFVPSAVPEIDDFGDADTSQRPAFVPSTRRPDEGRAPTGEQPAHVPTAVDDLGVADTSQRPAFVPKPLAVDVPDATPREQPKPTIPPPPPPRSSAPLLGGGGLAIPPTVPVKPSAPRSSGRWSGVPKTAELRTEAHGLPAVAPAGPEARIDLRAPPVPEFDPTPPNAKTETRPLPGFEPKPIPPPPSAPSAATEVRPLPGIEPKPSAPPPSAPSAKTEARPLPVPPPSAPTARTEVGPKPVAPAAAVPASMMAALRAQRSQAPVPAPAPALVPPKAEAVDPDPGEVLDLDEPLDAPADRTIRGPMPVAPPDDRTGAFEIPLEVVPPPPKPLPAPDRVLASNPFAFATPAPKAAEPLKPTDPSPLAAPRTQRGKDSGLKPAVQPRAEPARHPKKEAVHISVKELVRTTPRPEPVEEKTSVMVDPAAFSSPAVGQAPRRTTTRDLSVVVPRGVLKAVPVRRSRKVDDLAYLGPPPEFVKDSPLVGIDLGTTNSVCAVLAGGRPVVLKTASGSNIVPSLVAINKAQKLAVGYAAHAEMLHNPAHCIYGSKRLVGRDFESPAVDAVRERFAYEIVAGPDGKAAVMLGGKLVSLEEIQAIVLTECRLMAEKFLSKRVSRAVITCPAYFTEQQRQSIRVAGALAGLRVERILIEPTAAALAYGLNQDLSRRVLVYDVGGGTFDATLLRIEKNVFEVLATGGDVFLGGLDFDHQLIDSLVKRFEAEHNVLFNADPGALARIADQAEKAKIALSEKDEVKVHLPMLQLGDRGRAMGLTTTLTRAELEMFCAPLIDRTLEVVQGLLKDAKLKASQVDEVVLVGGMSRMPMVRERLRQLFKKQPHASINAEEAIAVGAALFTGVVDQVSNVVLIDVAPMTIGFGLPGGGYKRLIHRNTPLPASASIGMATTEDMSEVLEINVFQGEDADVAVNDYVGTIRIDGLPRAPKGVVKVAINLKLDADCVLHVDARELHTRRRFATTLATRYTTAEVQGRLGIKPQAAKAAVIKRTEEIKRRSGGIFGFLKSAFSRRGR